MSPNTRSAFKKKELAMIDPELIALTPNIKVEEGDENPTMQQAISKQTTLAEQPLKLVPKPATAPKYAGLKASKKRKVNERSDAATESTLDPLKRVKVFATVTEDPPEKSATDGKPAAKANNGSEFAPAPKASRTKAKSIHSTAENLMNTSKHPLWYAKVNPKAPFSRGDIAYIEYTRTLVQHCQDAFERGDQEALEKSLTELTERVHSIEFCPALGLTEIKKSHIMERGGLSEIFSQQNAGIFPVYLRADAQCLFSRWIIKDFEPSVLRGIKSMKETFKSGKSRQSNSTLEQDYEFKKSAKVFGSSVLLGKQHIALVNGQWFANRACAYRDGAHGELEAGVCGKKDKGVYSIVLSHAGYADEDEGEIIRYCGTQSKDATPTPSTQLLIDSFKSGNEIRVLRKKSKSKYAPKEGVRYDGLYKIVGKVLLEKDTAMYRFEMKRIEGQDPIRYKGKEARPTPQELEQYKNIKKLLK